MGLVEHGVVRRSEADRVRLQWRAIGRLPPAIAQQARVQSGGIDLFDGLASTTDYQMSYPASVLKGLAARDTVEIDGVIYQVRSTRAVGDGSEMHAQLTRV